MRSIVCALVALWLWAGSAEAAMFGDFLVPPRTTPRVTGSDGSGPVTLTGEGGSLVTVHFPVTGTDWRPWPSLQAVALSLPESGEFAIFNLGGRPWFGRRQTLADGTVFYDGTTHHSGLVYRVAFTLSGMDVPDASVKQALAGIRLVPALRGSPASESLAAVLDSLERGDWPEAATILDTAKALDPGCWYTDFLRGRLEEETGDLSAAAEQYQAALIKKPDDLAAAALTASLGLLSGTETTGATTLLTLSRIDPDEPSIWEELGRIYLAAEDLPAARGYFQQAVCVNPASEAGLYHLAHIHATLEEYEDAFRRAREFSYYYPWLPAGILPDLDGVPGLDDTRRQEILAEPLPIGCIGEYVALNGPTLTEAEIARCVVILCRPPAAGATGVGYATDDFYDWNWHWRHHTPEQGDAFRPPAPGKPDRPRPPRPDKPGKPDKPGRPGPGRPGRPGRPGGPRPPEDGQRPHRPGHGQGERPDRPGAGSGRPGRTTAEVELDATSDDTVGTALPTDDDRQVETTDPVEETTTETAVPEETVAGETDQESAKLILPAYRPELLRRWERSPDDGFLWPARPPRVVSRATIAAAVEPRTATATAVTSTTATGTTTTTTVGTPTGMVIATETVSPHAIAVQRPAPYAPPVSRPATVATQPERRRGFFARLFGGGSSSSAGSSHD
ncbi:MAG: tetratricopeptide repeat protein, partial [Planctomycetes bacterium]|nr:tetratricopeptide repeat protein [Planctomycetota bacterium]